MSAPRLESGETRVQMITSLDPTIATAIRTIAESEERSPSHVIERLLKTHPRVQPMLEAETAGAGA